MVRLGLRFEWESSEPRGGGPAVSSATRVAHSVRGAGTRRTSSSPRSSVGPPSDGQAPTLSDGGHAMAELESARLTPPLRPRRRHEMDKLKSALHDAEIRQQDLGLQLQNSKIAFDALKGELAHNQVGGPPPRGCRGPAPPPRPRLGAALSADVGIFARRGPRSVQS